MPDTGVRERPSRIGLRKTVPVRVLLVAGGSSSNCRQAAALKQAAYAKVMPDSSSNPDNAETPNATPVPSGGTWSGRFGEPMSERMQRFNASVDFDRRLAQADIAGSRAHARMLAARGVISADDLAAIERGLAIIDAE